MTRVWAIAGTPTDQPYPCHCRDRGHHQAPARRRCDCTGRKDALTMPAHCCGRRLAAPVRRPDPCACDSNEHWRGIVPPRCPCIGRADMADQKHFCCAVRISDTGRHA